MAIDHFPKDCYYSYLNENNNKMHEYHVDTHHKLCDFLSDSTAQFGGNLSVHINGRQPVLLVGQDESTFHQYNFSKKCWKGPNGSNFLIPKSDGEMYMVSRYQSREFGLGFASKLTPEVLAQINLSRRNKHDISSEDNFLINGLNTKNDITDEPALRYSMPV